MSSWEAKRCRCLKCVEDFAGILMSRSDVQDSTVLSAWIVASGLRFSREGSATSDVVEMEVSLK